MVKKLIKNVLGLFRKPVAKDEYKNFEIISDLLYYAIRNQNEKVAKSISSFMYSAFKDFRTKNKGKEIIYPNAYYEVVSKTIEELATQKNRRFVFLEYRTAGDLWLLGEYDDSKISDVTFSRMWGNLILAIKYERDDYIMYHWEHAYQYIRSSLPHINPQYSDYPFEVKNQPEVDARKNERKRFLEFHYALGGLLLYTKRYNCIRRAFTYTQSLPPQYELLPDTMDEIFRLFFLFWDPYEMRIPWITTRYYLPETSGINADAVLKKWICQYIAVLLIRQYSIQPYLYGMEPLRLPQIPKTQSEKREWIDNLGYFKSFVEEVIKNRELLDQIGFSFITDKWFEDNNLPNPLDFIENVKQNVVKSFEGTLIEQNISDEKLQRFKDTTLAISLPVFKKYKAIINSNEMAGELKSWYINGESTVIDKSGFADNQDADHINFHSFLPSSFVEKYQKAISEVFSYSASKSYLLNSADITPVLLNLNLNAADYVIVSFGVNFTHLENESKKQLPKELEIIKYDFGSYHIVGNSLFIIRKLDLPKIVYKEITQEEIKKYNLEKINDEFNLYTSVIDLNISEELRNSLSKTISTDLRKSVYMGIFINHEIQWKKDIQCVQIREATPFQERGIVDKLSNIEPLTEKPNADPASE